jgi:hypothetical protein
MTTLRHLKLRGKMILLLGLSALAMVVAIAAAASTMRAQAEQLSSGANTFVTGVRAA